MDRLETALSKLRAALPAIRAQDKIRAAEIENCLAADELRGIAGELFLTLCRSHSALLNAADWKRVVETTVMPLIEKEWERRHKSLSAKCSSSAGTAN